MTLPAFAAERRAAALLLLGAGAPAVDRYILPTWRSAANPRAAAAFHQRGRHIGVAIIFDCGGSCKFSPLTSFTLDDISHS